MQRNSLIQLSDYSSIDDQETILNKIILKLDRVPKLSPSSHKLVPNKAVHPTNYFVPMKNKFTSKQDYIGDLEADYDNGTCHFHFLHLYLTVTYGLLISPYYPSRRDGHYNLIKNKFQKVSLIMDFHKWNMKFFLRRNCISDSLLDWMRIGLISTIYHYQSHLDKAVSSPNDILFLFGPCAFAFCTNVLFLLDCPPWIRNTTVAFGKN